MKNGFIAFGVNAPNPKGRKGIKPFFQE